MCANLIYLSILGFQSLKVKLKVALAERMEERKILAREIINLFLLGVAELKTVRNFAKFNTRSREENWWPARRWSYWTARGTSRQRSTGRWSLTTFSLSTKLLLLGANISLRNNLREAPISNILPTTIFSDSALSSRSRHGGAGYSRGGRDRSRSRSPSRRSQISFWHVAA